MPIAEIFTAAKVIEACFCGIVGNRVDAGVISAGMACVRQMADPQLPQNHHVLKAMHEAFVKSIGIMALACDSVGGSPADHFSRRALQRFARSGELKALDLEAPGIPLDALEERVRAIYGGSGGQPKDAATDVVIAMVESAMIDTLTDPLREVFRSGHARYVGWADSFELFFAADVKANTALFRILSFDRQNELIACATKSATLLDHLVDDLSEFRAEVRANHAEVMAALARVEASVGKGKVVPAEAIEIIARAAREGHLTDEQRVTLANIYASFLDATTEIPAPLIEAAKRQLAQADDPDLLDATLRNIAGEQRKALIAETETRVDDQVRSAAARYRRLASFAALESLADGIRLYRKALAIEQDDFWSWIELSRLYTFSGNLKERRRCAEQSLQHASSERERGVAESDLGDAAFVSGDLAEASQRFTAWHAIAKRLVREKPLDTERQHDLRVSFEKLGDVAQASHDFAAAREQFEEGLSISERLTIQEPDDSRWKRGLAASHSRLGAVEFASGDFAMARELFERSLAIIQILTLEDQDNIGWQRDLSVCYEKLGNVEIASGNFGVARDRYEAELVIRQWLAKREPDNAQWQRDLSVNYSKLGNVEMAAGNLDAARELIGEDLGIAERLAKQDPANAEWQRDLFVSNAKLAQIAEAAGDLSAAIEKFKIAEAIIAALTQRWPSHPGFAHDLSRVRAELARLRP